MAVFSFFQYEMDTKLYIYYLPVLNLDIYIMATAIIAFLYTPKIYALAIIDMTMPNAKGVPLYGALQSGALHRGYFLR